MKRREVVGGAAPWLAFSAGGVLGLPFGASAENSAGTAKVRQPTRPGDRIPWPTVTLLDGSRWGPDQARGHAVVVVWWSLHCPFCVRHNLRLEQLHRRIGTTPLRILTALREPDAAAAAVHLQRHGLHFPVTLEAQQLSSVFSGRRMSPLTATVDRNGRLLQIIPGEMSEEDINGLLDLGRQPLG
jgi:hypothetical protein